MEGYNTDLANEIEQKAIDALKDKLKREQEEREEAERLRLLALNDKARDAEEFEKRREQ